MFKIILRNSRKIILGRQKTVMGATFVIFAATLTSAFLGIWRNRVLSGEFYACCTAQLDVYTNAFRIPDMLFSMLVMGAFSASFIPVFAREWSRGKKEAFQMASTVITLVLSGFLGVTLLVMIFAKPLSILIAPGFSGEQITLMARLMRIMMISQIFFSVSNFVTAILQARQRFLVSAFSPVVYNISIILGAKFLSGTWGIYGPTLGVVLGAFLHLLIQLPVLWKLGFRYVPSFDIKRRGVGQIGKLMLPRSFSLGLGQLENLIAATIASTLPVGSVFIFNLAQQLMQLPTRLFGATIGQAALPTFARNAASGKGKELDRIVRQVLIQGFYISFPVSAIFLVLRLPLVRVAFGAREFPWAATLKTAETLAWFAPAIFAQTGIQILVRVYYALQDTKTPLFISLSALLTTILVSSVLVFGQGWGIAGLSLGISVGALIQLLQLLLFLKGKMPTFSWEKLVSPMMKIIYGSSLAAASSWLGMHYLDRFILNTTRALPTISLTALAGALGGGIYLLTTSWLGMRILPQILEVAKKPFLNGKSRKKTEVMGIGSVPMEN